MRDDVPVDLFDPNAKPRRLPDVHMESLPAIEKPHRGKSPASVSVAQSSPQKSAQVHKSTGAQEHESTPAQVHKSTRALDLIRALLTDKTKPTGVRIPPALLDGLDEVEFLMKKRHRVRLNRHMIFVAALASLLWDVQNNRQGSVYKALLELDKALTK